MPKRHPNRAKRQVFPVGGARFREARFTAGLGVPACAKLLRVSERTIRNWEAGTTRVPYAAYRLMRLLRAGRVLDGPWRGFYVRRDVLVTPEGHEFPAGDLAWWSLLIRQAREFRRIQAERRAADSRVSKRTPELRPAVVSSRVGHSAQAACSGTVGGVPSAGPRSLDPALFAGPPDGLYRLGSTPIPPLPAPPDPELSASGAACAACASAAAASLRPLGNTGIDRSNAGGAL